MKYRFATTVILNFTVVTSVRYNDKMQICLVLTDSLLRRKSSVFHEFWFYDPRKKVVVVEKDQIVIILY